MVITCLCVTLIVTAGFGDEDNEFRRINLALEKFSIVYPQQKVYLHLDKTSYKAGEIIWVKAYIVERAQSSSRYTEHQSVR